MNSIKTKSTKDRGGKTNQVANGTTTDKNQPTAEQLRIARMTADKTDADPEMMKKIKEVSDLTGRSADEAYTALHDCNGDANQAVDLLFEKTNNQDEWHEMKKKKKQPAVVKTDTPSNQSPDTSKQPDKSENWEGSEATNEAANKSSRGGKGFPRFGRGRGIVNGNRETGTGFTNSDRPGGFDGTRNRRRGGSGGGRTGGRNFRDRDQSGGCDFNNTQQHKPSQPQQNIDTWSNSIVKNGKPESGWNDDWTNNNDDWDGSLEESLVLTRSTPTSNSQPVSMNAFTPAAAAESAHVMHQLQQQQELQHHHQQQQQQLLLQQQQLHGMSLGSAGSMYNTPNSIHHHHQQQPQQPQSQPQQQLSYHQQQQLHHQHQIINDSSLAGLTRGPPVASSSSSSAYMSHFNKEATECIKNAVGIGPNSNIHQQQQMERAKQQQQQQQQYFHQHLRPKVPPPSKIPQSAVEMPGSMGNTQLDVQFGNWDSFANSGLLSSSTTSTSSLSTTNMSALAHMTRQVASSSSSSSSGQLETAINLTSKPAAGSILTSSGNVGGSSTNSSSASAGINLKQFISTGLSNASGSLPIKQHHHQDASSAINNQHQQQQPHHHHHHHQLEPSVVEMMTANNRLLQSETSNASGAVSSTISSSTSHGSTSAASTDVVSSGSHVSQFANSLSEEKKNSYYGQQPPAGFGQLQSSTQSLLSSPYQQQQQHIGLGSLGLSHSSNATTTNHTSVSTQNSTIISTGNMSYLSSSAGYSVPPPSTQPSNLSGVSGQIQYNQYGSGRGNNSESAGSMSYPAYNHHHQFPTKSYAEKQPSSTLNFENTSNTANLYHQQSPYNQSSNYPGSNAGVSNSGMYLGGGVSGANSYMPSNNANSENVFHQSQSEIMRGYQFRSGEVSSFQPRESSGHQSSSTNLSTQQTNKLVSEMTKLSLKDGAGSSTSGSNNQYDIVSSMISAASLTTATNTTSSANILATSITSNSSSLPTSSPSSSTSKSSITQLPGGTKSNTQTNASKQMMNYQGGVNYMISQPPGFPMAPFAYPHSQQALSQYGYDDVQLQSQRFNGGTPYYDYQSASGLQGGRGEQQLSASGADSKLALEATQTVGSNLQQQQQPASGSANQQFHTFQPGFGYYYPNQGIMPYYSMIPMSGMGGMQAVPMATNPAHQGSVPSSQYQQKQGNVYGSHPFNIGGQSQDFTKAFNNPQSAMTTKSATGGNHGDMLLTSGAAGFSKQHVQGFDKSNYHGGTPPPSFNISVPVCTQTGGPGGGQAMYGGGPYIPMMSHPNHTQMIHHHTMVSQDHSLGARGGVGTGGVVGGSGGNSAAQQKVGPNKQQYNNPPYWSAGN